MLNSRHPTGAHVQARKDAFEKYWQSNCARQLQDLDPTLRSRIYQIARTSYNAGSNFTHVSLFEEKEGHAAT